MRVFIILCFPLMLFAFMSSKLLLACALNIFSRRLFVLGTEELGAVAAEPGAELGQLFFEAGDRLLVHVGLGDDLRHVDCEVAVR